MKRKTAKFGIMMLLCSSLFFMIGCAEKDTKVEVSHNSTITEEPKPQAETQDEKDRILEEAAGYVENGDYPSGIILLRNAMNSNSEDITYKSVYEAYCLAYKNIILTQADNLAAHGDYPGAILKVNEGTAVIGEDADLTQKMQEYVEEQEALASQTTETIVYVPTNIEPSTYEPFYGIWCYGSKGETDAQNAAAGLAQNGFPAQVFVTTDWTNLNSVRWYVVTAGVYATESEAKAMLANVQQIYPDAYVKYSGEWRWNSETTVPVDPEQSYAPFYGIWCHASKDASEMQREADKLSQMGYPARVFLTTDWSNLNPETWYAVSVGIYLSEAEAKASLSNVQEVYPDAYVKYSGNWQG